MPGVRARSLCLAGSSTTTVAHLVGAGTQVAPCPLHGSRRAELPHRALALDPDAHALVRVRMVNTLLCSLPYPLQIIWPVRGGSVSDRLVLPEKILLGQAPSLDPLRRRWRTIALVLGLRRYYGPVRLPVSVHRRRSPVDSRRGRRHSLPSDMGSPSSCDRCFGACMGSSTTRSPLAPRASDACGVAFRGRKPRRHSDLSYRFRGSIPSPHVPLSTLRRHPCGRRRMTRGRCGSLLLSPCGSFIRYSCPVTGAVSLPNIPSALFYKHLRLLSAPPARNL
jgi:hypothetical protein